MTSKGPTAKETKWHLSFRVEYFDKLSVSADLATDPGMVAQVLRQESVATCGVPNKALAFLLLFVPR